ncbi:MAG: amidohydrolase family protein [Clostridia bacterium]|nr:amidohydrolase family protein [Clostridia bacterium]
MIIDFHTHCYPDKIAQRAVNGLSSGAGIHAYTDGSFGGLSKLMNEQGVGLFVVNNIATDGKRMHNVNDFAVSIDGGNAVSFGSVAPFAEDALSELERLKENGIVGVKFHPYFQDFYVDDPRLAPVYEKIRELGFIVVFHAGSDISFEDTERAEPKRLREAAEALGASAGHDVILAHWGASMQTANVMEELCGYPVYFDTAFGLGYINAEEAKEIVKGHGSSRILFGSDCPWSTPERELGFLNSLGLPEEDLCNITFGTAAKLLERHGMNVITP